MEVFSCVFTSRLIHFVHKCCVTVANKALCSNQHVEQSIGLESKSGQTHQQSDLEGDACKMNFRGKDPTEKILIKMNNQTDIFMQQRTYRCFFYSNHGDI